jgi:hypothetical protein
MLSTAYQKLPDFCAALQCSTGHQVAAHRPHSTKGALAGQLRSEYGFVQRQPSKEKIGVHRRNTNDPVTSG